MHPSDAFNHYCLGMIIPSPSWCTTDYMSASHADNTYRVMDNIRLVHVNIGEIVQPVNDARG